jgi:hypothetical protein
MKYIIIMLSILVAGCSAISIDSPLQASYQKYKESYNTPNEKKLVQTELWNTLVSVRETVDKSEFINSLAYFPVEMVNTTDFKESIDSKSGCLLVSGTDSDDTPMDYYIKFNLIDAKWIISEVTVKYFLDGSKRFLEAAECNEERRMKLWLESMESYE